jgi:FkbM family methyltransferase
VRWYAHPVTRDLLDLFHQRVPPKLQPVVKRLYFAGKLTFFTSLRGDLPARTRARLLGASLRLIADRPPNRNVVVALPGGPVILGRESYGIDALTLGYVWGQHALPMTCRGRVIVDLGAHKGYFSAWALSQGAVHVFSYEPQSANFDAMVQAQRQNSRSGAWTCVQAAVGQSTGTAELFIAEESWAHSLHREMVDAVAVEEVPMVTLSEVMRRVAVEHPGVDVVLKANVEGAVWDILFPASVEDLASVVQVDMDHEPGSPYDIAALFEHLAEAGLDDVHPINKKLFFIRRSQPARPETLPDRDGHTGPGGRPGGEALTAAAPASDQQVEGRCSTAAGPGRSAEEKGTGPRRPWLAYRACS